MENQDRPRFAVIHHHQDHPHFLAGGLPFFPEGPGIPAPGWPSDLPFHTSFDVSPYEGEDSYSITLESPTSSYSSSASPEFSSQRSSISPGLPLSPLANNFEVFRIGENSPFSPSSSLSTPSDDFTLPVDHAPFIIPPDPSTPLQDGLLFGTNGPQFASASNTLISTLDFSLFDEDNTATDLMGQNHTTIPIVSPTPHRPISVPHSSVSNRRRSHSHTNPIHSSHVHPRPLPLPSAVDDLALTRQNPYGHLMSQNMLIPQNSHEVWPGQEPEYSPLSSSPATSFAGDELPHPDEAPRVKIASDAVLRAAERRRRKKALFKCHICGNCLTSKDNLNNHIDAHRNIRRFECDHCHRKFGTRSVLKRHQRSAKCLSTRSLMKHESVLSAT